MVSKNDVYVNKSRKWLVSLLLGLLFIIIASPMVFLLVNSLTSALGFSICDKNGCPNSAGLVIHGIVFTLLVRALLMIHYDYES
jgi:hypothetical protein